VDPRLRELIRQLDDEAGRGEFPSGLNAKRVGAVEDAIRAIEAATDHPELRRIPKR
jgi:hypothetical protein